MVSDYRFGPESDFDSFDEPYIGETSARPPRIRRRRRRETRTHKVYMSEALATTHKETRESFTALKATSAARGINSSSPFLDNQKNNENESNKIEELHPEDNAKHLWQAKMVLEPREKNPITGRNQRQEIDDIYNDSFNDDYRSYREEFETSALDIYEDIPDIGLDSLTIHNDLED